ncbi:MAG: hypothetical protein ACK4VY_02195 [Brevundimonas sp.]
MEEAWPEHLLARNHPTREWRSRPEAAWEAIRHDYLAGVSARELCDRYGVALSTLRLKAKEGGWRRTDQADDYPWSAGSDLYADDAASDDRAPADAESWAELADNARFRLRRAIASGRAAEAASWLRVHERLRALVIAEADTAPEPPEVAPDPIEAVVTVARQVESLARRAACATEDADIDALQAEVEALEARAAALTADPAGPTLDSLDSLDPVFSSPAGTASAPDRPAGREALLRTRERRLGLGLGVSDLDQALAALDRTAAGDGLSP